MSAAPASALVIGVGNLLWADEGFGVRCVETFGAQFGQSQNLTCIEGGTQGLLLIPYFQEHQDVILFDAVDFGDEPGAMRYVSDRDVPAFIAARAMSLHQTGMAEVLACADLLGAFPKRLFLIGVQPLQLDDYGGGLTPLIASRVPQAVSAAVETLRIWGYDLSASKDAAPLLDPSLAWSPYETGRPDAAQACRIGDERFLPLSAEG